MDSSQILSRYVLHYISSIDESEAPEFYNKTFIEVFPFLSDAKCIDNYCCRKLNDLKFRKLYKHQFECYEALKKGKNVILISGTGSGKTEAWVFYAIEKCLSNRSFKVLAIYPTITLEKDQGIRLKCYFESLGLNILVIDAKKYEELRNTYGKEFVKKQVNSSHIILTNPAFFMTEIKNGFRRLGSFIRNVNLIVIDELDYYGSKRATLLIKLIELTRRYYAGKNFQIVITTATLDKSETLIEYLRRITDRETVKISGKPFKSKNITYIITGRISTLSKLYNELRPYKDSFVKYLGTDYEKIFSNFESFARNIFKLRYDLITNPLTEDIEKIMENKWGLLFEFREPFDDDFIELITEYVYDDGLTIVFCRDINEANIIHSRAITKCIERTSNRAKCEFLIRVHHHLIDPKEREEIERQAREGNLRIIISVKTLTQGIDIGFAKRVIHTYIPYEVREFLQKEGRKGRREGIISETIIFPFGNWYILVNGFESFRKWLEMGNESLIINPDNHYVKLFEAIYKHRRKSIELTPNEKHLIDRVSQFCSIKDEWRKFNFYEHSPPYGIDVKYLQFEKGNIMTKLSDIEISHRDLVEKYQPGFIDYSDLTIALTNAEIIGEGTARKAVYKFSIRDLQNLIAKPSHCVYSSMPKEISRTDIKAIINAIFKYIDARLGWGEDPNILRDCQRGKLWSVVSIHYKFNPIENNFARYIERAENVYWIIESLRKHQVTIRETIILSYLRKLIPVDSKTRWIYSDYTYVYEHILDPMDSKESVLFETGLVYLLALFRKYLHIPVNLLNYVIEPHHIESEEESQKRYLLRVWESEATGVIELLKKGELKIGNKVIACKDLQDNIINDLPDELTEVLMSQINSDIVYVMKIRKIDWNTIKRYALRALSYICEIPYVQLREEISRKCKVITLERPRKDLGIIAFDSLELSLNDKIIKLCALFNGEEFECSECEEIPLAYIKLAKQMSKVTLVHFGKSEEELQKIFRFIKLDEVEDVYKLLGNVIPNIKEIPMSIYEASRLIVEHVRGIEIQDLKEILKELMDKLHEYRREKNEKKKTEIRNEVFELAKKYLKLSTYVTYVLYLILVRIEEVCRENDFSER